jgi:poly(A) polymerase
VFTDAYLQAFDSVVQNLNISAYLCGGTVRDLLLNRPLRDVDVVLSDRVFEAAQMFRSKMNAPYFVLDEERQVARVVCGGGNWDFTGFRDRTIEGDLQKRDFTINALAIPWNDFYPSRSLQNIVDPFGGVSDLGLRLIRTVTSDSLPDDPLRMLRAFRIQAELQFELDPGINRQIEQIHDNIRSVAVERITEELDRILLLSDAHRTWQLLGESKLFDSLFPEMQAMKGCEQGGYHHLDVWSHSVLTLQNFESQLRQMPADFPEHAEFLQEYLSGVAGTLDRTRLLKWACLLHDIGKPPTRELKEPGRWRFHGHEHVGADLAQTLLKRLKFARKDAQLISLIIEHHLRPLNLFNQSESMDGGFYRFFRAAGSEAIGILLVSYSDIAAAQGPLSDQQRLSDFLKLLNDMVRYYRDEYYPAVNTPELVKGRDLMVIFQMKPGPQMGQLLKEIREAQLSGALRTREEALEFAEKRLRNK